MRFMWVNMGIREENEEKARNILFLKELQKTLSCTLNFTRVTGTT